MADPDSIELGETPAAFSTTHVSAPGSSAPSSPNDGDDDGSVLRAATEARHEFSLAPADRGRHALFFLAASFMMEALTWGFPFAFGVFQDYYTSHDVFAQTSQISTIGTCALGIMYLDIPLVMGLQRLYPAFGRWSPIIGLLVMCFALAASSFATSPAHLIVTQGVLYAIGGSVSYCPCILYMDEWFIKRKGLAYGTMWSGTGLAGFALPLLLQRFLDLYGFRTTLRIWAVTLLVLTGPLVLFIKPRLPPTARMHIKPFKMGFALRRPFLLHQASNVCQALGFFLPLIYLPTYARAIGASPLVSALTVLLINVASVFGCAAMGSLTDHLHATSCVLISALGSALGTFLLWGFATTLPILLCFCVVYGLFAGSYSSAWTGIMREISSGAGKSPRDAGGGSTFDPTMVLGILCIGRGLGSVVSGPLSQILTKEMPWQGKAIGGYGTGFGVLITFTGASAAMGGITFLWRRIGWM